MIYIDTIIFLYWCSDHFILASINLRVGRISIFDSLRKDRETYQNFINVSNCSSLLVTLFFIRLSLQWKLLFCSLNSAYRWYVKEGWVHCPAKKEKMDVCVNQWVRPFSNSNSFSYSLYRTMCFTVLFFCMSPTCSARDSLPEACFVATMYVNGWEPTGLTTITLKT